jgi:hypothetical protein
VSISSDAVQHPLITLPPQGSIVLAMGWMHKILIDLGRPDLAISLRLDPFAPRAARHHVALVDHPSPDLRDAVMLLTGELVTRAAQQCQDSSDEAVELRVWMPADVVRVELRAPPNLSLVRDGDPLRYGEMLLDQVADRWSIDIAEDFTCMWFEVDRHEARDEVEHEPRGRPDVARRVRSTARARARRESRWLSAQRTR